MSKKTEETSCFEFKVCFLDEDERLLEKVTVKMEVLATEDREDDRDQAQCNASLWAERNLKEYGADGYETTLTNAY